MPVTETLHKEAACRTAWGAVCRLQFHLTGQHAAGSVIVAPRGHGASSTVKLGALACGMHHMYVHSAEDTPAFKAAVTQASAIHCNNNIA